MGRGKNYRKSGGSASKTSSKPRPGRSEELKGVEFTYGTNEAAAGYEKVLANIVRHVAVQGWTGGDKACVALETGVEPVLVKPTPPPIPQPKYIKKELKPQSDGTEKEVDTLVELTEIEFWTKKEEYYLAKTEYDNDVKDYRANKKNWEENKSRMFNLVLQH